MIKISKDHPAIGDVFFLNLTPHTSPSMLTMKKAHRVVVIQRTFRNPPKRVIVVPCESFRKKHWNEKNRRMKYFVDYLLKSSKYPKLDHDTIVDCSQIFTIDSTFLTDYRFTLKREDIKEIQKRIAYIIGMDLD